MSGHVKWSDIRAEYVARAGGEAAVEAAGRRALRAAAARQATEDLEPAEIVRPFPWQCPNCGHHRDDHPGPVPTEQGDGAGFGTCTGCPSCRPGPPLNDWRGDQPTP